MEHLKLSQNLIVSPIATLRSQLYRQIYQSESWSIRRYIYNTNNPCTAIRFDDDAEHLKFHRNLFAKYVEGVLAFKEVNVSEPVPVGDFNAVQSLCALYDAFRDNPTTR